MNWQPPRPNEIWQAVDIYLSLAYTDGPPLAVRTRLETLRAVAESDFYAHSAFERTPKESPTKYFLRLGNRFYPHMKFVVERSPDGTHALYSADTHDRHIQLPPGSPEAAAFAELTRKNQELSQQIESAWEDRGVPTFKQFLRKDLARRRAER